MSSGRKKHRVSKALKTKKLSVRNWGVVTLRAKSGGGPHRDHSHYTRKRKHKGADFA